MIFLANYRKRMFMDFSLSKEMEMLRKAVREFANKKIAPHVDEWDEKHHFPYKEAMLPMGELVSVQSFPKSTMVKTWDGWPP